MRQRAIQQPLVVILGDFEAPKTEAETNVDLENLAIRATNLGASNEQIAKALVADNRTSFNDENEAYSKVKQALQGKGLYKAYNRGFSRVDDALANTIYNVLSTGEDVTEADAVKRLKKLYKGFGKRLSRATRYSYDNLVDTVKTVKGLFHTDIHNRRLNALRKEDWFPDEEYRAEITERMVDKARAGMSDTNTHLAKCSLSRKVAHLYGIYHDDSKVAAELSNMYGTSVSESVARKARKEAGKLINDAEQRKNLAFRYKNQTIDNLAKELAFIDQTDSYRCKAELAADVYRIAQEDPSNVLDVVEDKLIKGRLGRYDVGRGKIGSLVRSLVRYHEKTGERVKKLAAKKYYATNDFAVFNLSSSIAGKNDKEAREYLAHSLDRDVKASDIGYLRAFYNGNVGRFGARAAQSRESPDIVIGGLNQRHGFSEHELMDAQQYLGKPIIELKPLTRVA